MKQNPPLRLAVCLFSLIWPCVNGQTACLTAPSGLVSWWPAEGNANDVAGTNNGSLINGTSFGPGEVGQAFSFNGDNQYVQIADSPSLRPVSVTLECWFKLNAAAGGNGNLISKPVGTGDSDSYQVGFNNGGNLFGLVGTASGFVSLVRTVDPVPGVWYHVAYTFDNNTQIQTLYLNGVALGSNNTGIAIGYDNQPVGIGVDFDSGSPVDPFNGLIDEVSIYDRALTAAEVASIYAASTNGKCPIPPDILVQPQNQNVLAGQSPITFSVGAGGSPPLAYQWQFDTTNINEATNSSLTLTNVTYSEAGSYSVMVTNMAGATNSSNAVLTVNPPPPCTLAPSGLISWWPAGGNADDVAGPNNGSLINGASFGPGEVGQAFSFNGNDQYVQIADSPSLHPISVTLECWFNANAAAGGNGNLISKPVALRTTILIRLV